MCFMEIEPKDIAPVAKRLKIFSAGSTSSIEMEGRLRLNWNKLRSVHAFSDWSLTSFEYFLKGGIVIHSCCVLQQVNGLRIE